MLQAEQKLEDLLAFDADSPRHLFCGILVLTRLCIYEPYFVPFPSLLESAEQVVVFLLHLSPCLAAGEELECFVVLWLIFLVDGFASWAKWCVGDAVL